jgi:hypothetical protein
MDYRKYYGLHMEVSHQVTALPAPTIHAKDLTNAGCIASKMTPWSSRDLFVKAINSATKGSIACLDRLQTDLETYLEGSANSAL